jgi:hypothetical protein
VSDQAGTREGTIQPSAAVEGELADRPTSHWIAPVLVALIGSFMSQLDASIIDVAIPTGRPWRHPRLY